MSRSNKQKKANRKEKLVPFPPSLNLVPVYSNTFRFVSTSSTGTTIYRRGLLSLIMAAQQANNLISVIESIKLTRIDIWGASLSSDINFSTVSLEWEDTRGNSKVITDSGTINRPAHIRCKPPRDGTAGMWSNFTTFLNDPIMFLIAPVGSIIDVKVSFCIGNGTTNNASYITRTCVGGPGLFYLALDNSSAAGTAGTNVYPPPGGVLTINPTN